ncbi:hypothetical protein OIU84_013203 [Salix udensis]|uniref:Major facilitator superfamily (MFS) profile domain-containing protein n=1 Tax=Salix udensis TaxID=889485 RepID=A0AAD6JHD1_9ROSI|nr:hypothetical protein OIU84_013203 [Salix udensis]
MGPFLMKFFPEVFRKASEVKTNMYSSRLTAAVGRKNTIVLGGCTFLAGAAINGGAANIAMLLLGRILLGFGVGFTNQATPLYLSEVAPPKWRGAFSTGFQFFIGVGVVAANCINFAMAKHSWGWRFSLGLAVVPAAIMTTEFRGINTNVDAELDDLLKFNEMAKDAKKEPFLTIFERQYRPHLGLVNLGSILVSTGMVDRHGRRFLFIIGGIQMFICQVAVTVVLAVSTGISGTKHISKGHGILLLVLMCIYAAGFWLVLGCGNGTGIGDGLSEAVVDGSCWSLCFASSTQQFVAPDLEQDRGGGGDRGFPVQLPRGVDSLINLVDLAPGDFHNILTNHNVTEGGVTTMPSFLETFFPSVAKQAAESKNTNMYCMHLQRVGETSCMLLGGCIFFSGAALNGLATNVLQLILGDAGTEKIPKGYNLLLLVFMCIYAAGFGWSWNPLTVLIPSEIFPMRIRATGVTINIDVAFSVTFVLSQFVLTMLCHLKHSLFLFYGCWIAVMTVFVVVFLPETRGIPLEKMDEVWKKHWYWHRFVGGQL